MGISTVQIDSQEGRGASTKMNPHLCTEREGREYGQKIKGSNENCPQSNCLCCMRSDEFWSVQPDQNGDEVNTGVIHWENGWDQK